MTKIEKKSLPEPEDGVVHCYAATGEFLGSLEISGKAGFKISKWQDPPGALPFRPMALKRKHRGQ